MIRSFFPSTAFLVFALPASAATILSDDFSDGTGGSQDPVTGWSALPFAPEFDYSESPTGSLSSLVLTDIREGSSPGPLVFRSDVQVDTSGNTQTTMTVDLAGLSFGGADGGEFFMGYLNADFSGFLIANFEVDENDVMSFRLTAGDPGGGGLQGRYELPGTLAYTQGNPLVATFTFDQDSFSVTAGTFSSGDILFANASFVESDTEPAVLLTDFDPLAALGSTAQSVLGVSASGGATGNTTTATIDSVMVEGANAVPEPGMSRA